MGSNFHRLVFPTNTSNFRKYSLYDATVEEWTSILKLAHNWDFLGVKELALRELEQLVIPPLQKIVIYHSYGIDRSLLQAAYTAFAVRDEPITIEEGKELGLETAIQLARAREFVRAPASGGKRIKDARSPVNVAGAELDALIRDLFRLSLPDQESQGPQQKPTGRGSKTGGHGERPNGTSSSDPSSVQSRHRGDRTRFIVYTNYLIQVRTLPPTGPLMAMRTERQVFKRMELRRARTQAESMVNKSRVDPRP